MKKTKRRDITIPIALEAQITEYQEKNAIGSWTAALLELARIGLKVRSSK